MDFDNVPGITLNANLEKYKGLSYGTPEIFLEASSKGFQRLSAFFAYVNGQSIEITFQSNKKIDGRYVKDMGFPNKQELFKFAKGKPYENRDECRALYSRLWDEYIQRQKDLQDVLRNVTGIGDLFGRPGSVCQATELWRIRHGLLGLKMDENSLNPVSHQISQTNARKRVDESVQMSLF